ncbi:hypothetical protein A3Q56_04426 [Intoshia linei]|uniref:Uncharacterized protein n=1 Tax=Intoshia linei TaxID=1819745 RepID=A0A177B0F2_9BILA|nr:hypothetical protein A3Q56_04426 [Intoshia linei]
MDGDSRKTCIENLKKNFNQRKITFYRFLSLPNMRVEASYKVANILGVAGRSYMDGEIVETVKLINPGKESDFAEIPLSRVTIQRRQCSISKQLKQSLITTVLNSKSIFSLAVDESTDICDSAQLLIFVRSLSSDFITHEDLLSMETLRGIACGVDIFEAVKKSCRDSNLDMKNLRGICSDGAPAMIGRKQGFNFYKGKDKQCPLDDTKFLVSLAFQCLQGKNMNVCLMYRKIQDFMNKCRFLQGNIMKKQYFHLPKLYYFIKEKIIDEKDIPTSTFASVFDLILLNFED